MLASSLTLVSAGGRIGDHRPEVHHGGFHAQAHGSSQCRHRAEELDHKYTGSKQPCVVAAWVQHHVMASAWVLAIVLGHGSAHAQQHGRQSHFLYLE